MLQVTEIRQRFSQFQQTLREAEQVCHSIDSAPAELVECVERLARETDNAESVIQSDDTSQIVQCVDALESISDEAKQVSRNKAQMPAHLESLVSKVHAELSQLKHQLH